MAVNSKGQLYKFMISPLCVFARKTSFTWLLLLIHSLYEYFIRNGSHHSGLPITILFVLNKHLHEIKFHLLINHEINTKWRGPSDEKNNPMVCSADAHFRLFTWANRMCCGGSDRSQCRSQRRRGDCFRDSDWLYGRL